MQHTPAEQYVKKLESIVAKKPWFSIAQQLLLIEIKRFDESRFEQEQHKHKVAIYSLDREFLYNKLFHAPKNDAILQVDEQKIQEEEKVTQKAETEKTSQETESEKPVFEYPVGDYFGDAVNETSGNIIDKFLSSSQKIIVNDNDEIIESKSIKESEIFDNDEFATETLAKIYAQQGYISRAIEIYKKLSLQDSKKSTYFATLIENLRKRN